MTMSTTAESPATFSDYRSLLADRLRALKATDAKFSHRFVNQRMGARSSGWFSDVLAGRQKLKQRHVTPLATLLRLDTRERELLRILVQLETAETSEEKNAAYGKWLEFRGVAQEDIDRDRFKYFEHWHYPVLRELLLLASPSTDPRLKFGNDYAALGARLDPPLSARQTKEAVQTLSRLGLLNPGTPAPALVKRPGKTPHWAKILKAYTELALPAILKHGKDERDFSALTLSLSPEGLKTAGEEIAALRRRLLALSERDADKNRVFQCLFQVFPVTRSVEESDA
jgi:uncharacterized protein (TIGR02147 family)